MQIKKKNPIVAPMNESTGLKALHTILAHYVERIM